MDREYYAAYDDRYRQVHKENLRWFAQTPSHIVADVIRKYDLTGRMLEIGCGEGRDARALLEGGTDLLATDISPAAISFCKREWPRYADRFRVVNCIGGELDERFDFIYAVAVLHMLVRDEDRAGFYRFIREHLKENGYALICTMGDGKTELSSDISTAFDLQERVHEPSGKRLLLAGTSYRSVGFVTFCREIRENGLSIAEQGLTDIEPDYWKIMYAVVRKS